MKKILAGLTVLYSMNCFAGAGATFTINNLSPHTVTFKLRNPQCMNSLNTNTNFTIKGGESMVLGYIEAKASSSGGDSCATAHSTFNIFAEDPAAVDDSPPVATIRMWHTTDVKWDIWNSEDYNEVRIEGGSSGRFILSNNDGWTRWDGAGNITINYHPCEVRTNCYVKSVN